MTNILNTLTGIISQIFLYIGIGIAYWLPTAPSLYSYPWFVGFASTYNTVIGYMYFFDFLVDVDLVLTIFVFMLGFQFSMWAFKMVILIFRFLAQFLIALASLLPL